MCVKRCFEAQFFRGHITWLSPVMVLYLHRQGNDVKIIVTLNYTSYENNRKDQLVERTNA